MDAIIDAIQRQSLPEAVEDLIQPLLETKVKFIDQEGLHWDFKQEWPFSNSNEYFASILRLACAFANTAGGIIIFGVHDKDRTANHNKVVPNIDRFSLSARQFLNSELNFQVKTYTIPKLGKISLMLVFRRPSGSLPIMFSKDLGGYKQRTIWVRQGSEVLEAGPRHISLLFCRNDTIDEEAENELAGILPPSPATVKRFVGRLPTVYKTFQWLLESDEPRNFLFGKGGSGKTTIAYQIARTLKFQGSGFQIFGKEKLDNVIFVTAKEKSIDPLSRTQIADRGVDFSNENELYKAILVLGGWSTIENIESFSDEQLKTEIKEFFDLSSNFIVIDDIDTLTTKGIDAGFDFLYRVLARSKRQSKILYTLRNAPTHSLANAIEVPGLQLGGEFEEFISVCAKQFGVQEPNPEFRDSKIAIVSERRPLVIETIIALRRNSGNYDNALSLFEKGTGDDTRKYIFQREWDALPPDNYGRFLLTTLALVRRPISFQDIRTILSIDDARVSDALSSTREMFLIVDEAGNDTTYSLGALTRAFVDDQAKRLDKYSQIQARVDAFRKSFYPENPELTRLKFSTDVLINKSIRENDSSYLTEAWKKLSDPNLKPHVSEDPRFRSLLGYVALRQHPPLLTEARNAFEYALSMKFEPEIRYIYSWYEAERRTGYGFDACCKISDFVNSARTYNEIEKIDFLVRKAVLYFTKARENIFISTTSAIDDYFSSLRIHLIAYFRSISINNPRLPISEELCRNTAFSVTNFLARNKQYDDLTTKFISITKESAIWLDPLEEPIIQGYSRIADAAFNQSERSRYKARLDALKNSLSAQEKWMDQNTMGRVVKFLEATIEKIALLERNKSKFISSKKK